MQKLNIAGPLVSAQPNHSQIISKPDHSLCEIADPLVSGSDKAMNSIQQNGRKEILTDEQASSWKKAMKSIQQDGRKEMLTDEQASSWKKTTALAQVKKSKYNLLRKERPN